MSKEYTYQDVAEHNTKSDCFVVIHDKVYNVGSFVDEHPGGEEVVLDVAGQDATEAFEDIGHSDEAREILEGLLVGTLKRKAGDPAPHAAPAGATAAKANVDQAGLGVGLYAVLVVGAIAGYFGYQYVQAQQQGQ
jgi:cytochrome b involved in lipid metabolism